MPNKRMNAGPSNSKFERDSNSVENRNCHIPCKRVRKENHAGSSQVHRRSVFHLIDFQAVSWIWDNNPKKDDNNPKKDYISQLFDDIVVKDYIGVDHISQLSDDIIMNILSRLTMREAMRTSVLSSRWRYLWTFFTGILDFDASRTVQAMRFNRIEKSLSDEQQKFVSCVNKALILHQGPFVDELRICFDVNTAIYKYDIDSWINFAIEKRVKRLCLDLTNAGRGFSGKYEFPFSFIGSSSFNSLTTLHLKHVDVTGEVIKYFLSNCPLLEVLCVAHSSCLGNLNVSGPSLKLKHLELIHNHVEKIEISAINLVSFIYAGRYTTVSFKDVPRLAVVSLGGHYGEHLVQHNFHDLSSHLSQLVTLKLQVYTPIYNLVPNFPKLNYLKHLQLKVSVFHDNSVRHYVSLIEASPLLCRLSIQLNWEGNFKGKMDEWKAKEGQHQCLKIVEIAGFKGVAYDVAIIMYLVGYTVLLEKIIVDPYRAFLVERGLRSFESKEILKAARDHARELKTKLPPRVKLVIR